MTLSNNPTLFLNSLLIFLVHGCFLIIIACHLDSPFYRILSPSIPVLARLGYIGKPATGHRYSLLRPLKMSEDRTKISLRSAKRKARPVISAPRQISEPIPNDGVPAPRSVGGKISAVPPPPGTAASAAQPRPRPRPPPSTATGDLVKRRYSTRFNNLP